MCVSEQIPFVYFMFRDSTAQVCVGLSVVLGHWGHGVVGLDYTMIFKHKSSDALIIIKDLPNLLSTMDWDKDKY